MYTERSTHLLLKSHCSEWFLRFVSPVKIFVIEHFFNVLSTVTSTRCTYSRSLVSELILTVFVVLEPLGTRFSPSLCICLIRNSEQQ